MKLNFMKKKLKSRNYHEQVCKYRIEFFEHELGLRGYDFEKKSIEKVV